MTEQDNQRQQFWVILIIVFLGFLGLSMPYLIFPSLFLNPAFSILPPDWSQSSHAIFLGITLAAYPLGQFVGSPILGALSDDYGRKPLLAGSLLITAICHLISGFAIAWQHLELLIVSRFAAGLMEGNIAIARAMVADIKTISKHESFGKIDAVASIAYLLGPLLGGLMTDRDLWSSLTTSTPFYLTGIISFCLAGLSMAILQDRPIHAPTTVRSFWQRINLFKRMSVLFTNKHLQFLLIASTCFSLAVDIFYEFGPVYLTAKWMASPVQLILYNSILSITLAFGNAWLADFFSSRFSGRLAILCATSGMATLLLAMVLTESASVMMVLFALSGLAIGLGATSLTVKISNAVSDTIQGEVMGVQVSLRVLGDAMICLLGGVLLLISPKPILILAAAMSAASTIYFGHRTRSC